MSDRSITPLIVQPRHSLFLLWSFSSSQCLNGRTPFTTRTTFEQQRYVYPTSQLTTGPCSSHIALCRDLQLGTVDHGPIQVRWCRYPSNVWVRCIHGRADRRPAMWLGLVGTIAANLRYVQPTRQAHSSLCLGGPRFTGRFMYRADAQAAYNV